ncbi:MAG TPA: NAD-dependent epimerase/dehydratase family protein [Pyrinomonadaceae bacterium]|nr:NAD-dependent epimerase/dehydratase family protein [Pyrinomonadaceae bacterium]
MKVLIIGGTKFLGRHLIDAALQNGHEVTLFNRGTKYSDEAIERVEQIHGDRNSDLENLGDRRFDAVIDTSGYLPQTVKISAEFLKEKTGQYVFISSASVYPETPAPDYDETTRTAKLDDEQLKQVAAIDPKGELNGKTLGEHYGALKKLCEEEIERVMPGRVLNVRAGMIVGAFDWTDRFTYWVMRVAKGGTILAPGTPENFVQMIDARDLSEWIIKMIEGGENGIFNVTGKPFEMNFGQMLGAIRTATEAEAEFTWADEKFLTENNVQPWSEMPFYLPESFAEARGFLAMNIDKALEKGLKFRDFSETVRTVLNWRKTIKDELKAGISADREAELLEKWHARQ